MSNWIEDDVSGVHVHRDYDLTVVRVVDDKWLFFVGVYQSEEFDSRLDAEESGMEYVHLLEQSTDTINEATKKEITAVKKKYLDIVIDSFEEAAVESGESIMGANRRAARRAIRELRKLR